MEKNSEKIVMYRPGIEPGSPDYQSKKRGGGLQNIAVNQSLALQCSK